MATAALPELVEAAARTGDREIALSALEKLSERTLPSGTSWALGTLARSRALVAEGSDAEGLYQEAIEHLERTRAAPHLARTHLAYGEWLRRVRRRRDSRDQLSTALDLFASMGAEAFAERTRVELTATGEHIRRRKVEIDVNALTSREARIADLASEGASNAEIAAELFISPRTVEYHLHKVFRKLDVSSRTQLARIMPRDR
jgi:DNA-binding CsgD family transcriptional regulator